MDPTSWHRQSSDKPLFEDLLWSRPENKRRKAILTLIGGSGHQFAGVAESYQHLLSAGAGDVRILVPDSLRDYVSGIPNLHLVASSKTNSFAKTAVSSFKSATAASDATLVSGDLGRSSETAQALSALLISSRAHVILSKDSINTLMAEPRTVLGRVQTTLVASSSQLQKLFGATDLIPFTVTNGLKGVVDFLVSSPIDANIVTLVEDKIIVFADSKISITPWTGEKTWQTKTAAYVSVLTAEFPDQTFEALTTAVHLASTSDK